MAGKAIDAYLSDHLGGATMGAELAAQLSDSSAGTPLGEVLAPLAVEIEEDRETLLELMEKMGTARDPLKQASGWIAEKASRLKFSGAGQDEVDQGTLMAIESLTLGVAGKACLWRALKGVAGAYPALASFDIDALLARAVTQHDTLERERLGIAARTLAPAA